MAAEEDPIDTDAPDAKGVIEQYEQLRKQKSNGRAPFWRLFDVVVLDRAGNIVKSPEDGVVVKLQCIDCKGLLRTGNPSATAKDHSKGGICRVEKKVQQGLSSVLSAGTPTSFAASSSKRRCESAGPSLSGFIATPGQRVAVREALASFFFNNNVALSLIESEDLVRAFALLGVDLPSRTTLSTTILEDHYARKKAEVELDLKEAHCYAICTDGFKRKHCDGGTSLINVMALLPDGGARFIKVVPAKGVSKDAAWIVEQHKKIIEELEPEDTQRICGIIMDNTAANIKAMVGKPVNGFRSLSSHFPHLICIGCCDHQFNLLIKDMAKEKHCKWSAEIYADVLLVSNVINDSERIRALFEHQQRTLQDSSGRPSKGIRTNCDTRWAIRHMIACDILRNKRALKLLVIDEGWATASAMCVNAEEFKEIIDSNRFWAKLSLVIEAAQPISDAIHQLEADKPLLSQVRNAWKLLRQHSVAFVSKQAAMPNPEQYQAFADLVERRWQQHQCPAIFAAFGLDPMFSQFRHGGWVSSFTDLEAEEQEEATRYMHRFVKAAERDALEAELMRLKLESFPKSMASLLSGPHGLAAPPVADKDGKFIAPPMTQRRNFWQMNGERAGFPLVSKCAARLLAMHATTAASERNWSVWGNVFTKYRNPLDLARGEKIIFLRSNQTGSPSSPDMELALDIATPVV